MLCFQILFLIGLYVSFLASKSLLIDSLTMISTQNSSVFKYIFMQIKNTFHANVIFFSFGLRNDWWSLAGFLNYFHIVISMFLCILFLGNSCVNIKHRFLVNVSSACPGYYQRKYKKCPHKKEFRAVGIELQ